MSRSRIYISIAVILLAIYLAGLLYADDGSERNRWLRRVWPWYLLMSLGSYCLFKLGFDLLTFQDCPHEIKLLEAVRCAPGRSSVLP
jgi:hypothetical protein